jgi:hypothetical protein
LAVLSGVDAPNWRCPLLLPEGDIRAVAPIDGRMLQLLPKYAGMADAAAVETLCILPDRKAFPEAFKYAEVMALLLRFSQAQERA